MRHPPSGGRLIYVKVADLQDRFGRMCDVDITHIESGNLAHIAEYIAEHSTRA